MSILNRLFRKNVPGENEIKRSIAMWCENANATREERRDWFANAYPWDRVTSAVIDSIFDAITDKGLLEANYAKLGLSELEKMRRGPLGLALREGRTTVFPAYMFDQQERQLRHYLEF